MPRPWFTKAIIYEVDPRTFFDSDGDGKGDLAGLTRKLDYIAGLGVNTIWLNPFFESPERDDGYDVADFYTVDPSLGSLGDFVVLLEEARALGLRVVVELVVNHTSDQHPWFRRALEGGDAPTRDYYIWVDEPPVDSPERITFTPEEGDDPSPWTFHEPSGQYYLHRFYPHEPDLDHANQHVQSEMYKVMSTWLALGVDGFRIDAAPYIAEKAAAADDFHDAHHYLRSMRSHIADRRPEAILMAEADVDASKLGDYMGDSGEMNLVLSFLASQTVFLALGRESAAPLERMLEVIPEGTAGSTYANFLRNHDELDLERLSPDDREFVFETFAPDQDMRIFGRGIRRRPAPMLDGDRDRLRMAHSLIFSLPGVPVLRYGDEIGMGDDLSLPDRSSVRTPMQWTSGHNAGFSEAPSDDLYYPVVTEGGFGYEQVNVEDQEADPESQLSWTVRMIHARRQSRPMRSQHWQLVDTGNPAVLGLRYQDEDDVALTFHNLSSQPQAVMGDATEHLERVHPVFGDLEARVEAGREFELARYGHLWLAARTS